MKINTIKASRHTNSPAEVVQAEIDAAMLSMGRSQYNLVERIKQAAAEQASIEANEERIEALRASIAKLNEPEQATPSSGKTGDWYDLAKGAAGGKPTATEAMKIRAADTADDRRVRYASMDGATVDEARRRIPPALRQWGDCRLVWANEGDLALFGVGIPTESDNGR